MLGLKINLSLTILICACAKGAKVFTVENGVDGERSVTAKFCAASACAKPLDFEAASLKSAPTITFTDSLILNTSCTCTPLHWLQLPYWA